MLHPLLRGEAITALPGIVSPGNEGQERASRCLLLSRFSEPGGLLFRSKGDCSHENGGDYRI